MKYQEWNLRPPGGAAQRRRLEAAGLSPLCAGVLCARGLDDPARAARFLACDSGQFHDPFLLRDMDRAVQRVRRGLSKGETIAVYGDYDVDGITSTALLTEFLTGLGARVVSYIPNRMEEGYGLRSGAIDQLRAQGVSLIVTVDCGITADAEVEYAHSLGMDVVITDHHQCKETLPGAAAVVDPRRADCSYPFSELAGVGVALKLALALTPEGGREEVFRRYGELAAIGTVADVMELTGENRALVRRGLELLARTRRPGLRALLRESGYTGSVPTSVTVSYGLAPRINAAGRMGRAQLALELLLTRDAQQGEELAQSLCQLNRERQATEQAIFQECNELLTLHPELAGPVIVLAGRNWHQGVVGIVASRLAEKYSCPAFMICLEDGRGKGSCRSFAGFNLFAALEACAPLLEGYGGHELAAGFTVREENIPALRAALARLVMERTGGQPMAASLELDVEIDHCGLLTVEQVSTLSLLEPFGAGNPKPVFLLRSATVQSCCDVGGGRHLKMRVRRDGVTLDAIFFSANAAACGVSCGQQLDLAFNLQVNEFRGRSAVQLQLCDLRPAATRAQLEQALLSRLLEGELLTRWEAGVLLPERQDFTRLWRFLERACAAGPAQAAPEQLVRQALRAGRGHSYGRAMVCFYVMGERGLIQVERTGSAATVRLCRPERKVDLEQARLMRRLRAFLE